MIFWENITFQENLLDDITFPRWTFSNYGYKNVPRHAGFIKWIKQVMRDYTESFSDDKITYHH